MSDRLKDLMAGVVILAVFTLLRVLHPPFGLAIDFAVLLAVLYHAQVVGKRLLPSSHWFSATLFGAICFFALQSLIQTGCFYAGVPLGAGTDTWSMAAAMGICLLVPWLGREPEIVRPTRFDPFTPLRTAGALVICAASAGAFGYVLFAAFRVSTTDSIRTPWPLLPSGTLFAVALVWLGVLLMGWLIRSALLSTVLSALAIGATTLITPVLYRIGFGFDGFLHIASEQLILANGTLTPKPLYYIGQYVFTTWTARIASLPVDQIDRWLVPIAAAFLIPFALYLTRDKEDAPVAPFALLLIPLSAFIATTPQSFAYLLGLTALILAWNPDSDVVHPLAPLLLAAWSIAVHPLAGIPMALLVAALLILRDKKSPLLHVASRIGAIVCAFFAAFSIPILFFLMSQKGSTPIAWDLHRLLDATPWTDLFGRLFPLPVNAFVLWPAWATLIGNTIPFILIVATIVSIAISAKGARWRASIVLATSFLLFIAGAILKTAGDFAFLIDYERGNYADRLFVIATLCLIPASLPVFARLIQRMRSTHVVIGASLLTTCLFTASGLAYDALPRNDALVTGHGWSVGSSDLEAVRAIDRDAGKRVYTVLADQTVSAAAVSRFGFKRYHDDVFYYPIPTGGPLYETYLKMTYGEPSRDTVADAAALGGSDLVYVIVNDYWWNAANLSETISIIADNAWTFGDTTKGPGASVHVYKFDLKSPSKRSAATSGS